MLCLSSGPSPGAGPGARLALALTIPAAMVNKLLGFVQPPSPPWRNRANHTQDLGSFLETKVHRAENWKKLQSTQLLSPRMQEQEGTVGSKEQGVHNCTEDSLSVKKIGLVSCSRSHLEF